MSEKSSRPFDLTGEFGGFVFTDEGKRRLVLRSVDRERLLKVPRDLRRRMIGNFRVGQTLRVSGVEEHDPATGLDRWVVASVLPPGGESAPPERRGETIRVCAKKNCWRRGGRELFAALERGIEARGLAGQVRLKAVGCLDRCEQAPNVDCGGREFRRCTPRDADAILARAAGA